MHDKHDDFNEEYEHRQDGHGDIEIGQTVLDHVSNAIKIEDIERGVRCRPHKGSLRDRPVVGVSIQDLLRAGIEAIVGAYLPEGRSKEIRSGDSK